MILKKMIPLLVVLVVVLGCSYNMAFAQETTEQPETRWFHTGKSWIFVSVVLFSVAVMYSIYHARGGGNIFYSPYRRSGSRG